MEREKRKRLVKEETRDGEKKKMKMKNEKKKEEDPTDEEVDEFFRILKRMQVAMEYFGGVKSRSLISRKWSSAAMAEEQGLDDKEEEAGDQGKIEKHVEEIWEEEEKKIKSRAGMLDLNADPEQGV